MSRHDGRVSLSQTKPSLLVPRSSWRTSNAVCSPGGTVLPALMPGKWFVSLTDEVPRSSSLRSTTGFYKALPKGSPHAPAAGTATPWPRLQGCLQRQSTPSSLDGGKAKPQSASSASASSRGQLASAKKQSHTPGPPLRTVPPRGEPSGPVDEDFPFLGSALSFTGTARSRVLSGSPGAGNPLAGPVWGIDPIATTGRGWLRPPPYPMENMRTLGQGSGKVDFDPTHRSSAPRQLDHYLHDRTPWRTRPFQMSRVVLPLPWGEGGGGGRD